MEDDLNFNSEGLLPVIAQDHQTGEVRMLAYANSDAVRATVQTGYAHYYSRSRQELWKKGGTSGNLQKIHSIRRDCDRDALLYLVEQTGVACHTEKRNCFFEEYNPAEDSWDEVDPLPPGNLGAILGELQRIVKKRDENRPAGSYTTRLLEGDSDKQGLDFVLEKIGEESVELILAAKNSDSGEFAEEAGDLLYHLLVLCRQLDVSLEQLADVLEERRN